MRIVVLNSHDFDRVADWYSLLNKLSIPVDEQPTTTSVCFEINQFMYHVDDGVKVDCRTGKI